MRDVDGKTAFITGGASGIGLGMAQAFVDAGMKVMLADVQADRLAEAQAGFDAAGQAASVRTLVLDVTDRSAMAAAAKATEAAFGKVHVLCNNAGVGVLGQIKQARYGDWDWAMGVNLGGAINGIQEFLPYILKHGEGGHIVNTASMAAMVPIPNASIYITAKAGLVGLSESLRGELAADSIGVSAFCPGPVQSNIAAAGELRQDRYKQDTGYKEFEAQLAKRPASPEWMDPREAGERLLNGIRANDIFIFTHREFREGAQARTRAILAAFPDEPINEARLAAIRYITANPMYEAHLKGGD